MAAAEETGFVGGELVYDIEPGRISDRDPERFGEELSHFLNLKGFCVVPHSIKSKVTKRALKEASARQRQVRFEPPPSQVLDGLLGEEGSRQIAQVAGLSEEEEDADAENLYRVNDAMKRLSECLPLEDLGLPSPMVKTLMTIHQGGESMGAAPEMTIEECRKWLNIFLRARIMLLTFLGPHEGTLELQLYSDPEALPVEIRTVPGMTVVLRCDLLAHRHFSSSSDYTVSCWLLGPNVTGLGRGSRNCERGVVDVSEVPVVGVLGDWAFEYVQARKQDDSAEVAQQEPLPRSWQVAMNHFFASQNRVAVRGEAGHMPGTFDNDTLWRSLNSGMDYVTEVPLERWDHTAYYNPDPDCWLLSSVSLHTGVQKTNVFHGQFIEGLALFDYKFFGVPAQEARSMAPDQRHILETSYEALFNAGFRRPQLQGSEIGVYTGCTHPEWNYVDTASTGGASITGSSVAITSNRTSFILGMVGTSCSVDSEMASSAVAIKLGCTAVGSGENPRRAWAEHDLTAALCGGVYFSVTPFMWPRFNAFMNPEGRCFTFNDPQARGYVRGECCASVCLRPFFAAVDGELVAQKDEPCVGTIVGVGVTNSGHAASLTAPCGPSMQEATSLAVQSADISVLDLDGVECFGIGNLLVDCVEVNSLSKSRSGATLRGEEEEPLILGAVKTQVSAQCEAAGMTSFIKVLLNLLYTNNSPSIHLHQFNPHFDYYDRDDSEWFVNSEAVGYRCRAAFHGIQAHGLGGTNVHLVAWNTADEERAPISKPPLERQVVSLWPGGSGSLEWEELPRTAYYLVGSSFDGSGWMEPQEMIPLGEGEYACAVSLGESGWKAFQIWLDGDPGRVLCPPAPCSTSGSKALGPWPLTSGASIGRPPRQRGGTRPPRPPP
jgi:polyketide synthase-associated protein